MLKYKDSPSYEEVMNLSESERKKLAQEINDHNDRVSESWGSELLCLSTTQSRQLSIIPWSEDPTIVTHDLLERIISFYKEEINECNRYIDSYKKKIQVLEDRFAKATPAIYDKISSEIEACQDSLESWNEDLEKYKYNHCEFKFLMDIFKNLNEDYELIYTKC